MTVEPCPELLLPQDEVHLWYSGVDAGQDDARQSTALSVLTEDERRRCERFAFVEGQRECLTARCLVRRVLSFYAVGVRPHDWRFSANQYGRPEIAAPFTASRLQFNLSHSDGVVACAVSAHYAVGVDVERIGRRTPLRIADAHFAADEVRQLRALPEADQPRRFLEYWTLKEAYIKARGAGLSLRLDQFAFNLEQPGPPSIRFEPSFGDDAGNWQFDRLTIGDEHLVAVATQRGPGPSVRVVSRPIAAC